MLEWGRMRINNTLVCLNEVPWESTILQYAGIRSHYQHTNVLLILICMVPRSSILMCYWFSCDLIPAHWSLVDSHGIPFHHTNVLLILMRPHSSILMCYWFSWYPIPAYWFVNDNMWPYYNENEQYFSMLE
jgi:hypothetical protein